MNEIRLDLHTHSIISYDGGIMLAEYERILADKNNFIAITDHNEISFAMELSNKFAEQVIVGEEILTVEGEVIGLFLKEKIQPGQTIQQTCEQIHQQGGLVYIPHPLETMRKGLQLSDLEKIATTIDIVEVFNARQRQPWLTKEVGAFALKNNLAVAASSDAHGLTGFGTAFSLLSEYPTKENLIVLLSQASLNKKIAPLLSFLHPARNKFRKKFNL